MYEIRIVTNRILAIVLAVLLLSLVVSCTTVPGVNNKKAETRTVKVQSVGKKSAESSQKEGSVSSSSESKVERVYKIKELLQSGLDNLYQGAVSDGIRQLVAVLAEGKRIKNPNDEVKSIIGEAETTLAKIGSSLTMQAGSEWIDKNKNQITASTLDVGTDKALQPSVVLVYNSGGSGSIVVSNAPIVFRFVKGSGLLTGFVNTNNYGKANCSVAKFDNPQEENVIRATLVYRVKGYTYTFENVKRDFVYTPPSRKATILVMEKSKMGVSDNPIILDTVYNRLKDVGFDLSQYNGALLGNRFMRVFGGDPEAIRGLGVEKDISYIVMVLNDCYYVKQVELNGKKYNIYRSKANATTRIIRVSDGKIVYSGSVEGVNGQGGNVEKAIEDALSKASRAMERKLDEDLSEIQSVLKGSSAGK